MSSMWCILYKQILRCSHFESSWSQAWSGGSGSVALWQCGSQPKISPSAPSHSSLHTSLYNILTSDFILSQLRCTAHTPFVNTETHLHSTSSCTPTPETIHCQCDTDEIWLHNTQTVHFHFLFCSTLEVHNTSPSHSDQLSWHQAYTPNTHIHQEQEMLITKHKNRSNSGIVQKKILFPNIIYIEPVCF